ncbi:amino acid ABC transporter permease [Sphingobium sp. H39-3-25]|uniref:amino acid ABC transporter permease n=1 Tax=Sphingobium arseniciresistens TaxID=3030834 RepID=UPI0023BA21BC|nr:amino acid ABC transporter permease [Sphingobium arseniciresistens]
MTAKNLVLDRNEAAAKAPRIVQAASAWRWAGLAFVGFIITWIAYQMLVNPGFEWGVVTQYLLDSTVLWGVAMTIELTVLVMLIGAVIGVVIAVMNVSGDPVLGFCARGYVWFFRGVPPLVQLVFWYNLASLFPELSLGLPFGGPKYFSISATEAISSFTAAMLALGLVEGAYMAEVVRGGLLSIDPGQTEASKALGHTPWQTFRVVILPQAMKSIVPPTGNQVIGALKFTSLASVVALGELMHSVELIYSDNFQIVPLLMVAALWYVFLVSILSIAQFYIERHYSKGWRKQTAGGVA